MSLNFNGNKIGAMQYNGVTIGEAMYNGQLVFPPPVVTITGTSTYDARTQFRQACLDHGTTYQTVTTLPFRLDMSQTTRGSYMFDGCKSLTSVPDMDTSNVMHMQYMFRGCSSLASAPDMDTSNVESMTAMFDGCSSLTFVPDMDTPNVTNMSTMLRGCSLLTDGNVRLIGKHQYVSTVNMIASSGLTREPFYNAAGNPI